jgi:similar to stage IV sporulation protein
VKLLLLLRLWNYLRGYVIIIVEGYFLEKFLNICTRRQLLLWDITRHKGCIVTMRISIKGFKLLRPIAHKTGCRVRIVKKRGLPFVLNKYRRRKTFVFGAFIFVLLIFTMTSFIWSVEISGNSELSKEYIEKALSTNGIRSGALKFSIDTDKAVDGMLLGIREISWISIDVKGTKVKVQIRERRKLPDMVSKDVPCNVAATKDGIVWRILVTDGIEAAVEGETVKKGQILISGNIPMKNEKDKYRLVHAMGSVQARTWYEEQCPVVLYETIREKTGLTIKNYAIVMFTKRLELFNKKVDFNDFDKVEDRKVLSIGENLVFPFELIVDRYYQFKTVQKAISEDDAKKAAADTAYKKALERVPKDVGITKSNVRFIEDEDLGITAKVTLECLEDIGTTQEIGGK